MFEDDVNCLFQQFLGFQSEGGLEFKNCGEIK